MTGDNVLMHVRPSAGRLTTSSSRKLHQGDGRGRWPRRAAEPVGQIQKLRADVLKQAEASLSALIGKVNFSDTFAAAFRSDGHAPVPVVVGTSSNEDGNTRGPIAPPARNEHENLLFNDDKLHDAVSHANDMTKRYGVGVLSINIISARPRSEDLMQSLAKGAVAAAEAQQVEITARAARGGDHHEQGRGRCGGDACGGLKGGRTAPQRGAGCRGPREDRNDG